MSKSINKQTNKQTDVQTISKDKPVVSDISLWNTHRVLHWILA